MDMHSPVNAVNDNYIRNLESTFCESLHIEDVEKSEHASAGYDNCNTGKENLCSGFEQQGAKLNMNCLKKCSTLLYPDMILPPSSSDENDTSSPESLSDQSPLESNSCLVMPAPLTLVSAMKGSREKQGRSRLKLTVKWASDVYDRVPTLLSRTVKGKKQHKSRHRSEKKYVKKGQKGYPSKGSSSKDKKHYHRKPSSGTSDMWWLDSDSDQMLEASTELDDLNVVIHDSHCGTSFLKQSIEKVHYPVGEAL
ncbi:hypothetical protein Lal_00022125 [Lupinus albus]|uniref:Uncharacterized protein n=1 Tax=Lupinus albus TaxID=3870 RepID=A0A6A4QG93_LUPAL|nr:hypothetical protein Lalb_Chr06g0171041 [Lupinus albus]KAF1879998.1 hypothetical protein Lal_00022125 [Lupinus albus]